MIPWKQKIYDSGFYYDDELIKNIVLVKSKWIHLPLDVIRLLLKPIKQWSLWLQTMDICNKYKRDNDF